MEEGVGSALPVILRTAGSGETHAFVEGQGACILFVDAGGHGRMEREAVVDERAADAFAVPCGVDEEGVHMGALYQHEAYGPIVGVGGEPGGGLGQEAGDFGIDRLAVGGIEEVVGRIDGAAPDVEQASAIGGAGGADRYHGAAYSYAAAQAKGCEID